MVVYQYQYHKVIKLTVASTLFWTSVSDFSVTSLIVLHVHLLTMTYMSHCNLPSGSSVIVFYLFLPEEVKESVYLVYIFDKSCLFRNNG